MARFIFSVAALEPPVGSQFHNLSRHLCERGHNVVLLHSGGGQQPPNPNVDLNSRGSLTLLPWPSIEPTNVTDAAFYLRLLRHVRPHCVTAEYSGINLSMVLGRLCHVPARIAWHQTVMAAVQADQGRLSTLDRLRVRRRAFVYRCATRVVSCSEIGASDLDEWFKVERRRCVVIPNALEDPQLAPARQGTGPLRILASGRLVHSKGHATLVDAFARLHADPSISAELVVVGDGPDRKSLERRVDELALRPFVRLLGSVSHGEVMRLLDEVDVVVHPSLTDNSPYAIIEALGRGIPLVATCVGDIPNMIEDGRDGLLVPPGDPQALSAALKRILADSTLRSRLGSAGRNRFLERFELDAWTERVSELLMHEIAASLG